MEQQLYQLETDPVLRRLVAPMSPAEYRDMEDDIKRNGGIKGVSVWGRTILVDYEYYEYCHKGNIPFCLASVPLKNRTEAVAWICRDQLGRKPLPEEMRKYLIGKRSIAERITASYRLRSERRQNDCLAADNMKETAHENTITRIRKRIGLEYSLNYITVRKYEAYARSIDKICQSAQGFASAHLTGAVKMSFEKIERLASLPPDAIAVECQRRMAGTQETGSVLEKGLQEREDTGRAVPSVSIKTMPGYDPDAEIVSLSLTIPSWISSIMRVRNATNMQETSLSARFYLNKALLRLKSATDKMIYVLRKDSDGRL